MSSYMFSLSLRFCLIFYQYSFSPILKIFFFLIFCGFYSPIFLLKFCFLLSRFVDFDYEILSTLFSNFLLDFCFHLSIRNFVSKSVSDKWNRCWLIMPTRTWTCCLSIVEESRAQSPTSLEQPDCLLHTSSWLFSLQIILFYCQA